MISIVKATVDDAPLLSDLATRTFLESHGHSAKLEDVNNFVIENYNEHIVREELGDPKNIYHLVYFNDQPAGYSKIILNFPYSKTEVNNIAKFERIYLLKEFYAQNLGSALFNFNIDIMKQHNQAGVWLFVWIENERAVKFYSKNGFTIIGSHDFQISKTHSNPNHIMLLQF